VAGDFNETLGDAFGGMGRLVSECGLFDIVADRHGTTGFSTYQRGTKVLDYCLMTQDLIDSVHHCGYEQFKCNILSDHRGLFVDFSTAHLFGNIIQPLQPVALRDISSN
jgi:endonuclease/exonuclease/phosphatase family metal-dependent hydrolase